jgi:rfaE bifunctional protein nucleotidyltransferase chain/domain
MSERPGPPARDRVLDLGTLKKALAERHAGRTVVFTNGCFDLIHAGHVRSLEAAKAFGDVLVVGVNSDASVRRLKGETRPIVPERERAEVLAALRPVDYVVVFEDDTPVPTLEALEPDVHVKGGDYAVDDLPETPVVRAHGGRVEVVPFVEGLSTTDIIRRVRELTSR